MTAAYNSLATTAAIIAAARSSRSIPRLSPASFVGMLPQALESLGGASMKNWVSHWTSDGTFKIELVILGGSDHYQLWFNKDDLSINLGVYSYPFTAAESIGRGDHDQALGFAASKLGVPAALKDWNGFT